MFLVFKEVRTHATICQVQRERHQAYDVKSTTFLREGNSVNYCSTAKRDFCFDNYDVHNNNTAEFLDLNTFL